LIRPKLEVLSREEIEEIHWRSFKILSKAGVKIEHEELLKLLKDIGAEVDFNKKIAKIPEHIVKEALKRTPSSMRLYYRNGKKYLELGGWNIYFGGGGGAYYYIDWKTGEIRKLMSRDYAEFNRIVDALSNLDMAAYSYPADMPAIVGDRWEVYVLIKSTSKTITASSRAIGGVIDIAKLMAAVIGEENISKKSFLLHPICPESPLTWSNLIAQNLIDCVRCGIPIRITSMPAVGGTAPATLAGTILEGNAEFLVADVLAQFIKPGTPIAYMISPIVIDPIYGTTSEAYIELKVLINVAYAQLARFYGVPGGCIIQLFGDSKVTDPQASMESAFAAMAAVLSGMNLAVGAGSLMLGVGLCPIKLIIDEDIIGQALRVGRGVLVSEETLADWLIEEIGPGGHFFRHKHTREWIKKEFHISRLRDRTSLEMWRERGSKDLVKVAREQVEKILKEHVVEPLPPDIEKELDKIMMDILKRYGVEKMPSIQ